MVVDKEHSVRGVGHVEPVRVEQLARWESDNLGLDRLLGGAGPGVQHPHSAAGR